VRTKLLLAAVCIFTLPLWASPSLGERPINSAPYASVALAGHVLGSDAYCQCGRGNCICDPGEVETNSMETVADSQQQQGTTTNFGSELGIVLLAVLFLLRLRAA
jgi:hypothetical protein